MLLGLPIEYFCTKENKPPEVTINYDYIVIHDIIDWSDFTLLCENKRRRQSYNETCSNVHQIKFNFSEILEMSKNSHSGHEGS